MKKVFLSSIALLGLISINVQSEELSDSGCPEDAPLETEDGCYSCDELDGKMQELFSENNPNPVDYREVIELNKSDTNPKEDVKNMEFVNSLLKDTKEIDEIMDMDIPDCDVLYEIDQWLKEQESDNRTDSNKT